MLGVIDSLKPTMACCENFDGFRASHPHREPHTPEGRSGAVHALVAVGLLPAGGRNVSVHHLMLVATEHNAAHRALRMAECELPDALDPAEACGLARDLRIGQLLVATISARLQLRCQQKLKLSHC